MKLVELTPRDYGEAFKRPFTTYGSVGFNLLNAPKVDRVEFLAMQDDKGKYRLGAIFGVRGSEAMCPFSAPFGEISANSTQKIETVAQFVSMLIDHFAGYSFRLTLPPGVYGDPTALKAIATPALAGHMAYQDINYHVDLFGVDDFVSKLDGNARNHYNQASRCDYEFEVCGLARAYEIIRRNRAERGYPLRMTYEQMEATSRHVDIDSFILKLNGQDTAAAIVYRLNNRVAQLIYWGHLNEFSQYRPMNILSVRLFVHYSRNKTIFDLGPASSDGVADLGLCSFKESLGCDISFKPTFLLQCCANSDF